MKVPLSWLEEFVDVDLDVNELVDVLGRNGLEVEEVRRPGDGTRDVRTARVLAWQPHPDADKLRVVQVTHGDDEVELVCGARNFDVGDVVVHAAPGSSIPGMTMQAKRLRGVVSNGMLASAKELEVGEDADGIMILDPSTPLDTDITTLLPLGDPVIEFAVMADRGDHHSILGIAREVAAILDLAVRAPDIDTTAAAGPVPVSIAAPHACTHFVGRAVEGVTIAASPWWLRQRLAACGVRSISTIVDITNYVMLELGQPMHAFDLDRLRGPAINVRFAEAGERLTTLDDVERALSTSDLLVCDAQRPVALAGVMGGRDTEVSATTSRILFEAAVWDPATVRATSRRLNLVSEASLRFERRVDPAGAERAAARAVSLLAEVGAGGTDLGVATDGSGDVQRASVDVDAAWVRAFIGLDSLATERQAEVLRRSGSDVEVEGDRLRVTPPTWRGDLTREADLAEEIISLHGYDNIPATLPTLELAGGLTTSQLAQRAVRNVAVGFGLLEAVQRPFVGDDVVLGVAPGGRTVDLSNPLAKDAASLRPTLLEDLLGALRHNVGQGRAGTGLFEVARIFRAPGGALDDVLAAVDPAWQWTAPDGSPLPTQPRTLGVAVQGRRLGPSWLDDADTWSVWDVLAVFDAVVDVLTPAGRSWRLVRRAVERDGWHPGRSVTLHLDDPTFGDVELGFVGQLHPTEADRRDLPEPVAAGELLLDPLLAVLEREDGPRMGVELVRHPAMTLDVALVADDAVSYAAIASAVRAGAGELLDGLWWFDEYRGEQIGAGRRSLALRLRLQAADRQLTDADAEVVIAAVATSAAAVGATLRR